MKIIISHTNTDFDSLASMIAAAKLHPGFAPVFTGSEEPNVREFLMIYGKLFRVMKSKDVDPAEVSEAVIVDTQDPLRLGKYSEIVSGGRVKLTVYDHHAGQAGQGPGLGPGTRKIIKDYGATTTILLEDIFRKKIRISEAEATLFALGIYEDTGSMTYASTRSEDISYVSRLMAAGADIREISGFMQGNMSKDHLGIFFHILKNREIYAVNGIRIMFASVVLGRYVPDLSMIVQKIKNFESIDAVFVLALIKGRLNVIARSRVDELDAGSVLAELGGGGHPYAASAVIRGDNNIKKAKLRLLDIIRKKINISISAADIMTSPVKAVKPGISALEAGKIMRHTGNSGFPVTKRGGLIGLITKNEVDRACRSGKGNSLVSDIMIRDPVTVDAGASIRSLEEIMIKNGIGKLPVLLNDRLAGIITRSDIIMARQGIKKVKSGATAVPAGRKKNIGSLMFRELPASIMKILRAAGREGDLMKYNVYLVGGMVRDILSRRPNIDIDLVCEKDGLSFSKRLAAKLKGRQSSHAKFLTSKIILKNGTVIDVATARYEYYEFPAALPRVRAASLGQDLKRRDFTINAVAVQLNAGNFGDVIDYFGGLAALDKKELSVLYDESFIDDPTRIFRIIRFQQRFGFRISRDTGRLLREALHIRIVTRLTGQRILGEIELMLGEKDPYPALKKLDSLGLLSAISPDLTVRGKLPVFKNIGRVQKNFPGVFGKDPSAAMLLGFLSLFSGLDPETAGKLRDRLKINKRETALYKAWTSKGKRIMGIYGAKGLVKNSDLFAAFNNVPRETLYFGLALNYSARNLGLLKRFLRLSDGKVKLSVDGGTLKKLGFPEGPAYKTILDELLSMKLDGKLKNREEEIKYLEKLADSNKFQYGLKNQE